MAARESVCMDFALTEATYIAVRVLQSFGTIGLPVGEAMSLLGVERQRVTLVFSISEGCRVELK